MNERRNIIVSAAMIIRLALLLLLLSSLTHAATALDGTTLAAYAAEMSVNAEVQEQFFAKFPDLKDEQEIVSASARALVSEGASANDTAAAADAIAARARLVLARRTPQEWQRKAMSLFPELAVPGSRFNALFLRRHQELKWKSPQFMEEPSWPVLLARRCADELREDAPPASTAVAAATAAALAPAVATPTAPTFRAGWWSSLFNLALLLLISVQPARWLWRRSRAVGGREGAATLWQQALLPAAGAYLTFALIGLFRTFVANADQRFLDRFGITLLVSLLAGAVFALPVYGIAVAVLGWRRRRPITATPHPRV